MFKSLFGGKNKNDESQNITSPAPAAAPAQMENAGDDELIAVIMAAINASLGGQTGLVVRKITRVGDSTPVWGQIGRHEQLLNRL